MRQEFRSVLLLVLSTVTLSSRPVAQTVAGIDRLPSAAMKRLGSGSPGLELPRGTLDVRMEPREGTPAASWVPTEAPVFVRIPEMSATFVAAEDETALAITFAAEARTSTNGKRMFVRALIDGVVADPSDVVFTEGPFGGARSFTFTGEVDAGVHTVELEWLVDAPASAELRAATLLLRHGSEDHVNHRTPPSGDEHTTSPSWLPIPGTSVSFHAPEGAEPIVTFSAETIVTGVDKRLFVRARVDGVLCAPGDVVFARKSTRQCHQMSFTGPALSEGWHTASIEWLIDPGGAATIGDRTLLVTAFVQSSQLRHDLVVAPSGPQISTSSSGWTQIPNLSALVSLPPNAEIAVSFCGEVSAGTSSELEMRLMADGEVIDEETAFLASVGQPFEVQSFTFDRKHVFLPSTTLTGIWLEWRAVGGTVFMGDRAMELVVEPGLVPDLAEAPPIGGNSPVEAAIGSRKLLTIIHRIVRAAPNHVIPTVAQVTNALYGPTGVDDYYDVVSGGRFGFTNAGVVAVDALKTESHYWSHGPFGCGQPMQDGYAGGHAERWAEAISSASAVFDFAAQDTDQDGTVESHELAILIVVPQGAEDGFTRAIDAFCNGADLMVDGVVIPAMSEWFTSSPSTGWEVAAHELAHQVLGLGDMYANNFNFDTEVGSLSLMGNNFDTTSHVDGPTKLALGWATPLYAPETNAYALADVKESGDVLVLPRDEDGDGKEFFLLEVRRSELNHPLYDSATGANGLVIWHAVEEPDLNANPPACMSVADWAMVSSNARRGLRVVRPGVDYASASSSSWDSLDYDLLDGGLSCPPALPRNALLWADGDASGWRLRDFSAPGPWMTLVVEKP